MHSAGGLRQGIGPEGLALQKGDHSSIKEGTLGKEVRNMEDMSCELRRNYWGGRVTGHLLGHLCLFESRSELEGGQSD